MSRLKSFKETIFGVPKEEPIKLGKTVVSRTEQDYGKTPDPTFSEQVDAFQGSDMVQTAVRNLAAEVVGGGFETEMNPAYTFKVAGKTAKEYIDDWNAKNNLDDFLISVAQEVIPYGNSFATLTAEGGLELIPLKAMLKVVYADKAIPIYRKYWLSMLNTYTTPLVKDFLHFRFNVSSSSQPLGIGIMYALLKTRTNCIPNLLDVRERICKVLICNFEKSGFPPELWTVAGAGDDEIDAITTEVQEHDYGTKVVTSREGSKIETVNLSRDRGYDVLIEHIETLIYITIGDPMLKATIAGNFSEASIRGITALHKNLIRMYQRSLKRQIERVWRQVLKEGLYDPDQAQVKLVFNKDIPVPEPTPKETPQ